MSRPAVTKFDECGSCKHFVSNKCRLCQAGEFFEPEDDDEEPTEAELMSMFGGYSDDE